MPQNKLASVSMFGMCFSELDKIESFEDVANSNVERFKEFFHAMLEQGVYFAPSAFEAGFVSDAHHQEEIDLTLNAIDKVFAKLTN